MARCGESGGVFVCDAGCGCGSDKGEDTASIMSGMGMLRSFLRVGLEDFGHLLTEQFWLFPGGNQSHDQQGLVIVGFQIS